MRRLLLASAMVFLLCVSAAFGAQQKVKSVKRSGRTAALHYLEGQLQRYERKTWYWQRLTGSPAHGHRRPHARGHGHQRPRAHRAGLAAA